MSAKCNQSIAHEKKRVVKINEKIKIFLLNRNYLGT